MVGSVRAALTANAGRGEAYSSLPKDYRVVLSPLPSGEAMNRVVVLYCDVGGRPYRINDFREPLRDADVIKEVSVIGPFQMSHVWFVNFRTHDAKKKLVERGPLKVKARPCLVVDPIRRELPVKLHWVAFNVTNETIRKVFSEYGDVKEVASDKWRVQDFENSESTTRIVRLVLHEGVTPNRLLHQLRLGPGTVLVAVPGRAPMCLRCQRAGHIRRECRVPRCSECHAFGHEQADCTRSYARAVGRGLEGDNSDLVMDEEEAEVAAAPATLEPPNANLKEATGKATSGKEPSKTVTTQGSIGPAADSSLEADAGDSEGDSLEKATGKAPTEMDASKTVKTQGNIGPAADFSREADAAAPEGDSVETTGAESATMDFEVQPNMRRPAPGPNKMAQRLERNPTSESQRRRGRPDGEKRIIEQQTRQEGCHLEKAALRLREHV
ncbi:hypothetical protein HPB48_018861 [Haemaphysalis longicornis]|uniref:CCHC-type domain-containing protein n=1 Tax=Haemaphysalis longicornis TaxID=44386 RepID=A0A9J6GXN5_HAELO|nr:hypothetical protein HPB48_018861 [Haemaphysalis longicornis]